MLTLPPPPGPGLISEFSLQQIELLQNVVRIFLKVQHEAQTLLLKACIAKLLAEQL